MGTVISKLIKPVKTYNIENRAHKVISKTKPTVAPKYSVDAEYLKELEKNQPDAKTKIHEKNPELNVRLKDIFVKSSGDNPTIQTNESNLPSNRHLVPDFDFGFKEPDIDKIPIGKATLRQALQFISDHQSNPKKWTVEEIAKEYNIDSNKIDNILKYYAVFQVHMPGQEKLPKFATPQKSEWIEDTEVKGGIEPGDNQEAASKK